MNGNKLEDLFGGGGRFSEKVINVDSTKKIQQNVETDGKFVMDLIDVVEHSRTTDKDVFAKRANLTD